MEKLMTAKLTLLVLVMAAAVVLAGCRAKDSNGIHASPEAVHQALCDAIQAKDWQKMAGCWTPEWRDALARELAATAAFGLFDVPQSAVQELFKRHGLDDVERKGPKAFEDLDQVAFIADMLALLEQSGDDDGSMPGIAGSTLANLKVEDGKAMGDLVSTQDGKEHWQGIEFHQIDGRWFVHLIGGTGSTAVDPGDQDSFTIKGYVSLVKDVAFSPDGRRLASVGREEIAMVWDTLTWEPVLRIQGHTDTIGAVAFSPEGSRLATGCWDNVVRLFDAHTGQQLRSLEGHTDGGIDDVAFSADGRRLASVDSSGRVILWDTETGGELFRKQGYIWVTFSHDGQRLAARDAYNMLRVWDVATGSECYAIVNHSDAAKADPAMSQIEAGAFDPLGKFLATAARDGTVKLYDATAGHHIMTLQGHTDSILCVAFSPEGNRLASSSLDGSVRIWDTNTGRETLRLRGDVVGLAFSPDGRRLAGGNRLTGSFTVWEVPVPTHASNKAPSTNHTSTNHDGDLRSADAVRSGDRPQPAGNSPPPTSEKKGERS